MTQIIYTSRTPYQAYQRCKRLRWLSTHEGEQQMGLEPKRKSLHLVVGSAVHAGMEVLLQEGQQFIDQFAKDHDQPDVAACIEVLFEGVQPGPNGAPVKNCRVIEDRAVAAAIADLLKEMNEGVELDPEEQAAQQAAKQAAKQADGSAAPEVDMGGLVPGMSSNTAGGGMQEDSPIVIEFEGFSLPATTVAAFGDPALLQDGDLPTKPAATTYETNEQYLLAELSSLVEGMVRAWARRRWRGVLEQFEVLEVEREGEWKLADVEFESDREWFCRKCSWVGKEPYQVFGNEFCPVCHYGGEGIDANPMPSYAYSRGRAAEIHFLSRHDALLLERQTGYLYLQSFKTTGSWDRRKEMDAQVDMQGLSEAVDVERRFAEAWELLHKTIGTTGWDRERMADRLVELVSPRVAQWLATLPDPPQILGVRYEYLLKGSRKKDKKDAMNPDRYVQESILCRAYKQEGITSDDRRWAWTYDWQDETGKGRRLDYRSWSKSPVWKYMSIAEWIDLLDAGKVQEGALNEQGEPMDALAEQFVPVLTVYRNSDEMLDLLEQMESQEMQIAKDVEEVRRAEREEGYAGKRTALNKLFGQTRTACSYPGVCQYRTTPTQAGFCFGGPDPFHDPTVLERFQTRQPNHPKEGLVQIDGIQS